MDKEKTKLQIAGTGIYLPETVMTNSDWEKYVDTTDEWIYTRTGIKERRIAKEETVADMAYEAAKQALLDASLSGEDIDLIIAASSSGEQRFPSAACQVQGRIHAEHAAAFDLSAACSGFLYALEAARGMTALENYKNVLIIGAEKMSSITNPTDRTSCVLFGDGAGAWVLRLADKGIEDIYLGSNGSKGDVLVCKTDDKLTMNGQEVFRFALKVVPACIETLLERNHTDKSQVKSYVLHQANSRITEAVAGRLKEPVDKFPSNIEKLGNTSAASIPILLDSMRKSHTLTKGDKIVLSGFGAGLTWGAALMEL